MTFYITFVPVENSLDLQTEEYYIIVNLNASTNKTSISSVRCDSPVKNLLNRKSNSVMYKRKIVHSNAHNSYTTKCGTLSLKIIKESPVQHVKLRDQISLQIEGLYRR